MRREGHTSTSYHRMWKRSTSIGMDEAARGTHATDGTKVGPGRMAITAKFHRIVDK